MIFSGTAYIFDCISKWFSSNVIKSTRKFVPPKSRAKNCPRSAKHNKNQNNIKDPGVILKGELQLSVIGTKIFVFFQFYSFSSHTALSIYL